MFSRFKCIGHKPSSVKYDNICIFSVKYQIFHWWSLVADIFETRKQYNFVSLYFLRRKGHVNKQILDFYIKSTLNDSRLMQAETRHLQKTRSIKMFSMIHSHRLSFGLVMAASNLYRLKLNQLKKRNICDSAYQLLFTYQAWDRYHFFRQSCSENCLQLITLNFQTKILAILDHVAKKGHY